MHEIPASAFESRPAFEKMCNRRTVAQVLGDVQLHIDPDDDSLAPHLLRDGYWESWVSVAIGRVVQPEWVCVDAGAHFGYYTALMSRCGARGVLAFEPQPSLARLIRRTVDSNRLMLHTIVEVKEYALAESEGQTPLYIYGRLSGSASLGEVPELKRTGEIAVRTTTLDVQTRHLTRLDLLKIDCEGAEERIWRGMIQTRVRFPRAVIVMEIGKGRGYDMAGFLKQIGSEYPLQIVNMDGDIVAKSVEEIAACEDAELTTLWLAR